MFRRGVFLVVRAKTEGAEEEARMSRSGAFTVVQGIVCACVNVCVCVCAHVWGACLGSVPWHLLDSQLNVLSKCCFECHPVSLQPISSGPYVETD